MVSNNVAPIIATTVTSVNVSTSANVTAPPLMQVDAFSVAPNVVPFGPSTVSVLTLVQPQLETVVIMPQVVNTTPQVVSSASSVTQLKPVDAMPSQGKKIVATEQPTVAKMATRSKTTAKKSVPLQIWCYGNKTVDVHSKIFNLFAERQLLKIALATDVDLTDDNSSEKVYPYYREFFNNLYDKPIAIDMLEQKKTNILILRFSRNLICFVL